MDRAPDDVKSKVLAERQSGTPVSELSKKYKVSQATIYNWLASAGIANKKPAAKALSLTGSKGGLENENRRLRNMVVDLLLELDTLRTRA